jgi:4-hydroxy-tetrahydrodipicolinate reductase
MIRAGVAGAHGKMGLTAAGALADADDIEYVGGLVRSGTAQGSLEFDDLDTFIAKAKPQVLVDFSLFPDSKRIALAAIERGVRPVIGTSGYGADDIAALKAACAKSHVGAVFAPNFAIGAVLMMQFADAAAKHYPAVEIVEMHETGKKDAPSGTAMATARRLTAAGNFKRPATAAVKIDGARGAEHAGIGIHSLRLPGVVAHQEVLFGGKGELLTIRHDSFSRESFMAGVLLAVRAAATLDHFVDGLGELL